MGHSQTQKTKNHERIVRTASKRFREMTYAKLVDDYLSEAHRDHPGSGCAISALAGEIARSSKRTRALLTEEIRNAFQLIADLTPSKPTDRRDRQQV